MPTIFGLRQDYFLSQFGESQRYAVISDKELVSSNYQVDALATIRQKVMDMPHRQISDFYSDLYRDLDGYFSDNQGSEVFLDCDALADAPDEWWRDAVQTIEPRTTPIRLRAENRERLRVVFSIHRAVFPEEAALWGVRPANDND